MKEILIDDVRCRVFESGSPRYTPGPFAVVGTSSPSCPAPLSSPSCPAPTGHLSGPVILIQPTARHEIPTLEAEFSKLVAATDVSFVLVAFEVSDWTLDLMPWPDRNISREEEAGHQAQETLDFVLQSLLPYLEKQYGAAPGESSAPALPAIIGGYSLGGLFALWASTLSDRFCAVAAASPSLWIRDWVPFIRKHSSFASDIYMSLGDREEHVKNQAIARVGDCVRETHHLLAEKKHCTLVWEPGNHFTDNDGRLARAFSWCLHTTCAVNP